MQKVAVGDAVGQYAFESLGQWKAQADAVAVLRVTSERELEAEVDGLTPEERTTAPDPKAEVQTPLRVVTVAVEQVLWSTREDVPMTLDIETWGWLVDDEGRTPFAVIGGPRVEVGEDYVAALRRNEDGGHYSFLSDDSIFVVGDDGTVTAEGRNIAMSGSDTPAELSAAEASVVGLTPDELSRELRDAVPADVGDQDAPTTSN